MVGFMDIYIVLCIFFFAAAALTLTFNIRNEKK